jgi:hypothetical protein
MQVPYPGSPQITTDLIGSRIMMSFQIIVLERPRWRALHQGKHARMLGVAKEAGAVAVHCDSGSRS